MKTGLVYRIGLALLVLWPFAASAQGINFTVDAWRIEGENPIGDAESQAVLAPFLGKQTGLDGLQSAAAALETLIHDKGFTFYRVVLPPQDIKGGAVVLAVYPFKVGDITVEGNEHHSDENILRSLPALKKGESPNAGLLSKNLALANLNSSKRARLTFGPGSEAGMLDARIEVSDRDPRRTYLWLNDTGNEETGEYRFGLGYHDANFLDRDQLFSASLTTSPTEPDQVVQGGINWRAPLYGSNALVSALAIESDVDSGTVAEVFDVRGRGSVYGAAYSRVLPRSGNYRHVATVGVTDKFFDSDIDFSEQAIGVDVRSRPLHLDYTGEYSSDSVRTKFSVTAVTNLSGGSYNDEETYAQARTGADPDWTLFRADLDNEKTIKSYTLRTVVAAQYADEPLIAGEQFGLGGARSVRGFQEREITGDRGFWARLEVIAPRYKSGLRFGWFLDGGLVERVESGAGESDRVEALSTGLLMSWEVNRRLLLHADLAQVLNLSDPGDAVETREDDARAHFNVTYFFE